MLAQTDLEDFIICSESENFSSLGNLLIRLKTLVAACNAHK
jgi:hypothetical protein